MNKGLIEWLKTDPADIICVQEIKAHKDECSGDMPYLPGWDSTTTGSPAQKKGYSGVAVFTKVQAGSCGIWNGP